MALTWVYRWSLLFVCTALLAQPVDVCAGSCGKVLPIDEAPKNASFLQFRTALIAAVQQEDHQFLTNILDPKIFWHWDPPPELAGAKGFVKTMKPEERSSPVWNQLLVILTHGGGFQKNDVHEWFEAPYISTTQAWKKVPPQCADGCAAAIFGENVRVRAHPSSAAATITTLSYDVVHVEPEYVGAPTEWVPVRLESGRSGYVAGEFIRNTCDFRATFEYKNGKWLMTTFIEGD